MDYKVIYLQPECCADPEFGRVWCEDSPPQDCDHDNEWTKYVRADLYEKKPNLELKTISIVVHDDKIMLVQKDGEAMEVDKSALDGLLQSYYEANF